MQATERNIPSLVHLGQAYRRNGREAEAQAVLEEILAMDTTGNHAYLGFFYVDLGELDLAFEQFEQAYIDREYVMVWLRTNSFRGWNNDLAILQSLRDDSRLWELLERMNYPPLPPSHPGYEEEQAWLGR